MPDYSFLAGSPAPPILNPLEIAIRKQQYQNSLSAEALQQQQIQAGSMDLQQRQQAIADQQQTQAALAAMARARMAGAPPPGAAPAGGPPPGAPPPGGAPAPGGGLPFDPQSGFNPQTGAPPPAAAPAPAAPAPSFTTDANGRPKTPSLAELIDTWKVPPSTAPAVLKSFQDTDLKDAEISEKQASASKATGELNTAVQEHAAEMANGILKSGMNPVVMQYSLAQFSALGPSYAQQAQKIAQQIQANPAQAQALLTSIANSSKGQREASAAETTAGATATEKTAIAGKTNQEAAQQNEINTYAKAATATSQQQWNAALTAPDASPAALAKLPGQWSPQAAQRAQALSMTGAQQSEAAERKRRDDQMARYENSEISLARQRLDNEQEPVELTPQAKDQMATMFATTGTMPNLGMGKQAGIAKSAIINRAAELYPNVSFASNAAAYAANKQSLKNVTSTLDTLSSFESAGLKNLKMFTDAAAKIPDTGIPWLNTPVRLLSKDLVGSENMAVVETARNTALREIARVTSDPKLSGVLSDSARHEVQDLSPQNATLPQIIRVAHVLQQDMANVHESLSDQKEAIVNRLGSAPDTKGNTADASRTPAAGGYKTGDSVMYGGVAHKVLDIKPNGKLVLSQ